MSDWVKQLQKARTSDVDEVPKGWATTRELMVELGLGRSRTNEAVQIMLRRGEVERKLFKILIGDYPRTVPHYKLR